MYDLLAQSVEHLTFNQRVMSSNLIQVTICLSGGIGRRTGLKILRESTLVPVQVRPQAPSMEEYPSLVEGTGLENRKVAQAAQGFESLFLRHLIAGQSSLVARWAHNPEAGGSNPPPATNFVIYMVPWCSWLTRLPVTQKIAGSSPVGTAIYGFIAQSVEQGTENPCVAGSIPAGATILLVFKIYINLVRDMRSQLSWIECLATNQKVRGSNPFERTIFEKWLNLVEHVVWDHEVAGSNPVFSTIL